MEVLFYTIVGTVVGTVIAMALLSEGSQCLTRLNRWIVRRVLSRLPADLPQEMRDRWTEEIEADLTSLAKRPLAGLWFALGLERRGARRLAAELMLRAVLAPAKELRGDRDEQIAVELRDVKRGEVKRFEVDRREFEDWLANEERGEQE